MASRRVTVKWTKLEVFEKAKNTPKANDYYGIYAIFESGHKKARREFYKFGNKELIYVGIVWDEHKSFRDRMNEHLRDWDVWGDEMYVKFGVIYSFSNIDRQMIEDIESAFIMIFQPSENNKKKKGFTGYEIMITNDDPDKLFPRKIDTANSEHIEWVRV